MIFSDFSLFLPFFFVLAVVYGSLQFSGIFQNKAVMAIISVVIGFFAMSSETVVNFIMQLFVPATVFFIIFFFIGFVYSVFKKTGERDYTLFSISLGLMLLFFLNMGNSFEQTNFMGLQITQNFIAIMGFIFMILIFYAAYKKGTE